MKRLVSRCYATQKEDKKASKIDASRNVIKENKLKHEYFSPRVSDDRKCTIEYVHVQHRF